MLTAYRVILYYSRIRQKEVKNENIVTQSQCNSSINQ